MNLEELIKLGATLFQQSKLSGDTGSNLDLGNIVSALNGLAGEGRNFDLGGLISSLESGGLGSILGSWLGDGANEGISPEQIGSALGADKVTEFASNLGLSESEALGGLSDAIPQMIDKASSGGSILDSLGGIEGVIGLAGKLFK